MSDTRTLTAAELADAIDPREVLDTSPTGQPGIVMWCPSAADLITAADFIRATCPPATTFPDQLRTLARKFADKNETHAAMMMRKAAGRDEAMEAVLKLIAEHAIFERDGFVSQGPMLLMSKLRRIEELARTAIPRTPE